MQEFGHTEVIAFDKLRKLPAEWVNEPRRANKLTLADVLAELDMPKKAVSYLETLKDAFAILLTREIDTLEMAGMLVHSKAKLLGNVN